VSKTRPSEDIREAYSCGLEHFGENYLQEALDKIEALSDLPLTWHFIGPIQSNKTRAIAAHFHWVHSVEREKIARRLNDQRPPELPPLQVCLQVNISGEASKSGVSPGELPALAAAVAQMPRLALRGLMAVPAPSENLAEQRAAFARLRELRDSHEAVAPGMDTLSRGRIGDMDAAIAEGATILRIGTAIFGPRDR
jgi:pyridoxal phosphate enzyme (YggS family)